MFLVCPYFSVKVNLGGHLDGTPSDHPAQPVYSAFKEGESKEIHPTPSSALIPDVGMQWTNEG